MQRVLLLILLLTPACGRREVATGNWLGAAPPDAAPPTGPTREDQGSPVSMPDAAAPSPSGPDAGPGAGFQSPDAGTKTPTPPAAPDAQDARAVGNDPADRSVDASTDVGDARPCPETGNCD